MMLKNMLAFPPGKCSLSAEQLDSLPQELDEELKTIGGLYPVSVVWGRKAT
jgi:hypothetical protein